MKKILALIVMALFIFSNTTVYAATDVMVKIKALDSDVFKVELINNSSKDIQNITINADVTNDLKVIKAPSKITKLAKGSSQEVKFRVKKEVDKVQTTESSEKNNKLYIGLGIVTVSFLGFVGFRVAKSKQLFLVFIITGALLNTNHSVQAAEDIYKKEIVLFEKNVTVTVKIEYGNEKESTSKKKSVSTSKSKKVEDTHGTEKTNINNTLNQTQTNITINQNNVNVQQENTLNQKSETNIATQTQNNVKANDHSIDVAEKVNPNETTKSTEINQEDNDVATKVEVKPDQAIKDKDKDNDNDRAVKVENKEQPKAKEDKTKQDQEEKIEHVYKKETSSQEEVTVIEESVTDGFSKKAIENMKDPKITQKYIDKYGDMYKDTIQKYQKLYTSNSDIRFLDQYSTHDQYDVIYTLVDLNNDDTPELIVAGQKDGYFIIDNIFSKQDNEILPIFDSYKYQPSFGRRTTLNLYQNGIWVFGSGGASSHSVEQFKLDKHSQVELLNKYVQDGNHYTFNDEAITQESFSIALQDLEPGRINLKEFNWYNVVD